MEEVAPLLVGEDGLTRHRIQVRIDAVQIAKQQFSNYPRNHMEAEDFFFDFHTGYTRTQYTDFVDKPQRNWEASVYHGRLRFVNYDAAVDGAKDGQPFDIKFCKASFNSFSKCDPGTMFYVGVTNFQRANCRNYVVVATEENHARDSYRTRFLYCTVP